MFLKKILNGFYQVVNVNKAFFIIIFLFFSYALNGQSDKKIPLKKAILEIAKTQKVSVIFNPNNIPDLYVQMPSQSLSLIDQIKSILKETKLESDYKNDQIFLFKRKQIFGYIEDGETGQRLIAATVLVDYENYDISNDFGYFSLSTIQDSCEIEISYLGYSTFTKLIAASEMNKPILISLQPDNKLDEVVISDLFLTQGERQYIELDKGSDILLKQYQATSVVGGEPDIFQAFMRQTGINAGTDGIGGIHVRGGKNDQNLILYDGVKLYNSAHAFGLYSIINNSIIDQARLTKSGATGSFSGRLSSVMDIKTKDPDLKEFHVNAQVSTLASQLGLNIPIVKDILGITLTGRRTHIDGIVKSLSKDDKISYFETGESNYRFSDYNVKMYSKISNKDRLYFTYYFAEDKYDDLTNIDIFDDGTALFDQKLDYDWSNEMMVLRYNSILSSNTFANFQFSKYQYNYQNKLNENFADSYDFYFDREIIDFTSGVTSYEFRADFETSTNTSTTKYGINGGYKNYQVGDIVTEDYDYINSYQPIPTLPILNIQIGDLRSQDVTLYISNKLKTSKNLLFSSGIYLNKFWVQDKFYPEENTSYLNLFGYFKTQYQINPNLTVGASIGTFVQNEHLLTTGDNGYPSDIWLPSTFFTPPERSYQADIFINKKIENHSIYAALFYKKQTGIVFYDTIPSLPSITILVSDLWEEQTVLGDATGYGFEIDYKVNIQDKINMRIGYTYNTTDYSFDFIKDGESFPFDYSIPHTISFGTMINLSKKTNLSIDWVFNSGKPFTLYDSESLYSPLERLTDTNTFNRLSNFNELRLPSSHKLSIAISHNWNWGKAKNEISLGLQNVYNRKNVLYEYELIGEGRQQQTGFPRLPIVRWSVEL